MKCIDIMVDTNIVYDEVFVFNRPINIETNDDSRCIKVSLQDEVDIYGVKVDMSNAVVKVVRLIQKSIEGIEVKNEDGGTEGIYITKWKNELHMETSCARFCIIKLSDYKVQIGVKTYIPVVKES